MALATSWKWGMECGYVSDCSSSLNERPGQAHGMLRSPSRTHRGEIDIRDPTSRFRQYPGRNFADLQG